MAFFNSAVDVLQTLVVALGAGLGIWGVINLMERHGTVLLSLFMNLVRGKNLRLLRQFPFLMRKKPV